MQSDQDDQDVQDDQEEFGTLDPCSKVLKTKKKPELDGNLYKCSWFYKSCEIYIYAYIIYVKNNIMKFNILFAYIEVSSIQYTLLVYILWAFTFENF